MRKFLWFFLIQFVIAHVDSCEISLWGFQFHSCHVDDGQYDIQLKKYGSQFSRTDVLSRVFSQFKRGALSNAPFEKMLNRLLEQHLIFSRSKKSFDLAEYFLKEEMLDKNAELKLVDEAYYFEIERDQFKGIQDYWIFQVTLPHFEQAFFWILVSRQNGEVFVVNQ